MENWLHRLDSPIQMLSPCCDRVLSIVFGGCHLQNWSWKPLFCALTLSQAANYSNRSILFDNMWRSWKHCSTGGWRANANRETSERAKYVEHVPFSRASQRSSSNQWEMVLTFALKNWCVKLVSSCLVPNFALGVFQAARSNSSWSIFVHSIWQETVRLTLF